MKLRTIRPTPANFFSLLTAIALSVTFVSLSAQAMEVAFEADNNLPIVYLNVAINSGATDDPPEVAGLSRFMGEMLLRGTKTKSKEQIDLALDQMGAVLGVDARSEMLVFRGAVISSQLVPYLNLLFEILTQPTFPQTEIDKLKAKTVSDIMGDVSSDRYLASLKFSKFLFGTHPYGNPVKGTVKGIKAITREKLLEQYQSAVVQQRLIIVGTGDSNFPTIKNFAEVVSKARPEGTASKKFGSPHNFDRRTLFIVDKPDRTQVQIIGGHIGIRLTDPDYYAFYIGNDAFGGSSFQARLMKEIRAKRGWTYGAYSAMRFGRQPHSWQFSLFPGLQYADQALKLSIEMIEEVKQKGITEEEFLYNRDSILNNSGFRFNTPQKRVENLLMEQILELPSGFFKNFAAHIARVRLQDVNASLKARLKPELLVLTVVATDTPETRKKLALAAGVSLDSVQVVPYKEEE